MQKETCHRKQVHICVCELGTTMGNHHNKSEKQQPSEKERKAELNPWDQVEGRWTINSSMCGEKVKKNVSCSC